MIEIQRARVLDYRFGAHGLGGGGADVVLATGVQDYPPGRSALLALRVRGVRPNGGMVLVHSVRGAMHLHRAGDLALLRAALRVADAGDMPPQSIGPFGAELAEAGVGYGEAVNEVAAVMRDVVDGNALTKGELSGAVSPQVRSVIAPWCGGCGVFHVQDQLFRMATLQAGLVIELDSQSPSKFRFRSGGLLDVRDPGWSRAELVRGFLATFGPAKPAQLASWLGITPTAARRWWELVADELCPVTVDGSRYWTRVELVDALQGANRATGVRLLPPYDPLTELADRALVVPKPAQRKLVWRATANPGVVVVDGEIAGVWRQKRTGDRLTLRVEPFGELAAKQRKAAEVDAVTIAGPLDVELVIG